MSIAQLTRFVAFRIGFRKKDPEVAPEVFVLCVPVDGLPVRERNDEIAGRIVRDQHGFLRYILFLLGAFDPDTTTGVPQDSGGTINGGSAAGTGGPGFGSLPLLEEMTRAYCRDPARLDAVRRLIQHLRESDIAGDADEIVPDEFVQMWDTFEAALKASP